jgi:hypothetical protein
VKLDDVPQLVDALRGELPSPSPSELPRVLGDVWGMVSRHWFGGRLPSVEVVVVRAAPRLLSRYLGGPRRVEVGAQVARVFPWAVARVVHEAVHADVEAAGFDETSYHGHGPEFCARANFIGEALGVGRVTPKGRGGAGLPGEWPAGKPNKGTRAAFAGAALLPVERRELDGLRGECARLRAELDAARGGGDAGRRLVRVCGVVGKVLGAALRERDAVLAVSRSGGGAAAARAKVRHVEALRDAVARVVEGDAAALAALAPPVAGERVGKRGA